MILTLPNLVSALRLAAIPFFWWVAVGERRLGLAAGMIFAIGATDWIDGFLARRLNQVSKLGKFLDPLADRLMIATALVAGLVVRAVPLLIGILLLVREVLVAIGAAILAARGGGKLEVRYLGKLATFLLYGAIPSFYLAAAGVAEWLFAPGAWITGVVGLVLYYWVAVNYLGDIRRVLAGTGTGPVTFPGTR